MSAFAVFYLIAPIIDRTIRKSEWKQCLLVWVGVLLSLVSETLYTSISNSAFSESGKYLSTHSPFAVLFEFLLGMHIFYMGESKRPLVTIAIIGCI